MIIKFFWRSRVSISKFRYWSNIYVNIITGSGVITIFVDKGLTRNPETKDTPVRILPNIWRLGQVRYTKFGRSHFHRSHCIKYAGIPVSSDHFFVLKKQRHRLWSYTEKMWVRESSYFDKFYADSYRRKRAVDFYRI